MVEFKDIKKVSKTTLASILAMAGVAAVNPDKADAFRITDYDSWVQSNVQNPSGNIWTLEQDLDFVYAWGNVESKIKLVYTGDGYNDDLRITRIDFYIEHLTGAPLGTIVLQDEGNKNQRYTPALPYNWLSEFGPDYSKFFTEDSGSYIKPGESDMITVLDMNPSDQLPWLSLDSGFYIHADYDLDNDGNNELFLYNNVYYPMAPELTPVPEPTTIALLAPGVAALIFGRKYLNKNKNSE